MAGIEDNTETRKDASPMDVEADDVCWICLDDNQDEQVLMSPCKCPRKVHPKCLARWQLQQAGKQEETTCRFCNNQLADWKASLTPEALRPEVQKVQPIMVVYFEGEIHRIPVKQGGDGLKEFTTRIRELFRLPEDVDISLTFGCKEPMSGQHLKLEGMGAFDAAVHCASVAAAERQHKIRSGGGASSGAPSAAGSPASSAGGAPPPAGAAAPDAAAPAADTLSAPVPSLPVRQYQSQSHGGSSVMNRFPTNLPPPATFLPQPSSGGGASFAMPQAPPRRMPPAAAMLPSVDSGNVLLPPTPSVTSAAAASPLRTPQMSASQTLGLTAAQQASLLDAMQPPSPTGTSSDSMDVMDGDSHQYMLSNGRRSLSLDEVTLGSLAGGCDPTLAGPQLPDMRSDGYDDLRSTRRNAPSAVPTRLDVQSMAHASPFGSRAAAYTASRALSPTITAGTPPPVHAPNTRHSTNTAGGGVSLPPLRTAGSWATRGAVDPAGAVQSARCAGDEPAGVRPLAAYAYGPSSTSSSPGVSGPHTPSPSNGASRATSCNTSAGGVSPTLLSPHGSACIQTAGLVPQPPASSPASTTRNSLRRMRRSSSRQDVQEGALSSTSSEGLAPAGSLTGRLKCSLKAFSRKVARSLHFSGQAAPGAQQPVRGAVSAGGAEGIVLPSGRVA
uniref:RING-CH-type domain-containing protein n=1 Tax=Chlamydomonas leiostraca TaxID=1034604 RepID=A0A7S0RQR2_9CHLO|mmetsp:Transcript_28810/g.73461  ORF Transcript_28810/g.73461 Transcript_28810/m.73461 type:complete len:670 (+) Transcript_28810:134-2143(+)